MFRPGSIFYDEHGQPPAKTPPSTLLAPDSVPLVSLVSPPPSPSRNSIFDQPWSTPARPNITSLRATTSNQTNASLSSLSSLSATRPNNSTTPAASIAPDNEYSPSKSKSKSKSNGNYSAKILLHNNNSNTSLSGTNQTISISMEEPSETTIESSTQNHRKHDLEEDQLLRRSSAHHGATKSTSLGQTASGSHSVLRSPAHVPRTFPSPALSPLAPSIQPPASLLGSPILESTMGDSSITTTTQSSPFTLALDCSRPNLLGHGRHAEVYKALIHPSSTPMRQYLLSRKDMRSMSCQDIFDRSQSTEHCTDKDVGVNEDFRCAAKCLFADADSQAVGLAEAKILRRLHTTQAQHPGRRHLVDYFGLYDQKSKQSIPATDNTQHDLATSNQSDETRWALLLEYCQHGSIWDWIRQHPEQVGFHQWLTWAIQLLQAVDCIHEAGLIHHDIKPHNILLDSSLNAKLSDFGAGLFMEPSKPGEEIATSGHLTLEEGRGRGTLPYAAPEMFASAAGGGRYSQGIDVYSLGVSLYVIGLTAQEPFHKLKSVMEMIVWIKKGGFWLWEDQGWIHDRGPIPKVTSSSRLSTSAALAQGQVQGQVQGQELKSKKHGLTRASRSSSSSSIGGGGALMPNLPPINTQLSFDRGVLSPLSACSVNSLPGSHQNPPPRESPLMHPVAPGNHFLPGFSPERLSQASKPSTPVSPLPLPSPMVRSTQAHRTATVATVRKDEHRKSGEVVMRFLNGEVVQPEVIMLLKEMCHPDPEQRPNAKTVLERLESMKAQLDMEGDDDVDQEEHEDMQML